MMDIQILLALEHFREGFGSIFRDFLFQMTSLGDFISISVFLAAIYWCIDKDFGVYMLVGFHWNRLVNGFLKVTVCAYRPWIREPMLIPDEKVVGGATGYSFPSGHSMNAASVFGGMGLRRELKKSLRAAAWATMVLIAFSRVYFSVHTPQDILVGPCLALLVMYGAQKAMPILEKKNMDIVFAAASILLAVLIAVYASVKSYPVDYDAEGKILVDGMKMAADTFKAVGWNVGFFVGLILERRFVKFTTECDMQTRMARLIAGVVSYYFVYGSICPMLKDSIGGNMGTMASSFAQMFYIVLIFPLFIKLIEKNQEK